MDIYYLLLLSKTLFFIFIIGLTGYKVFKILKIPSPALTGALFANAITSVLGIKWVELPSGFNVFLQILIGIMVGSQFNKDTIKTLKKYLFQGIIISLYMVIVGFGLGYLIYITTDIDLGTALISTSPGGIAEMSVLAITYDFEIHKVIWFQFSRVLVVTSTVPILVLKNHKEENKQYVSINNNNSKIEKMEYNLCFTFAVGILGGCIAWRIGIPSGGTIGALLAVGTIRTINNRFKSLPRKYAFYAEIGIGASLGLVFTPEVANSFLDLLGISIIFMIIIFINVNVLSYVTHKIFNWELATAYLACAPAGMSQMVSIALNMNEDVILASVIHTIRLIFIITILPFVISFITNWQIA